MAKRKESMSEGKKNIIAALIDEYDIETAEDIQKDLFSPYVTHGKKGGVGLGLYATKLILETIHGWELTFRSSPQETVFRITFRLRNQQNTN